MYGRAYVLAGSVIGLHVSSAPISITVMSGCDVFDLTLGEEIEASELTFADGAVSGPGVLTCTPV